MSEPAADSSPREAFPLSSITPIFFQNLFFNGLYGFQCHFFVDQFAFFGDPDLVLQEVLPHLELATEPLTHEVRALVVKFRHVLNLPQLLLVELSYADARRYSVQQDVIISG